MDKIDMPFVDVRGGTASEKPKKIQRGKKGNLTKIAIASLLFWDAFVYQKGGLIDIYSNIFYPNPDPIGFYLNIYSGACSSMPSSKIGAGQGEDMTMVTFSVTSDGDVYAGSPTLINCALLDGDHIFALW